MSLKGPRNGAKALIVDDTPVALKALRYILLGMGCQVVMATSGMEAVRLFDPTFDVVFMDFFMPEMSGDEVTKLIRQREESFDKKKPVYIVGITANDSEEVIKSCFRAGMNRVEVKPIHLETIEEVLRELDFMD